MSLNESANMYLIILFYYCPRHTRPGIHRWHALPRSRWTVSEAFQSPTRSRPLQWVERKEEVWRHVMIPLLHCIDAQTHTKKKACMFREMKHNVWSQGLMPPMTNDIPTLRVLKVLIWLVILLYCMQYKTFHNVWYCCMCYLCIDLFNRDNGIQTVPALAR